MTKEIELKYFLSSLDDLKRLFYFLKPLALDDIKILKQKNMYFDDNIFSLRKNKIILRLREEQNIFLLCAKQEIKNDSKNLSVRFESEVLINKNYAYLIKNNYLSALDTFIYLLYPLKRNNEIILFNNIKNLNINGVYSVGSFINLRSIVPINIGNCNININLDHSYFPSKYQFFEVEIEFTKINEVNKIRPLIEELLIKAKIKLTDGSYKSKSCRLHDIIFSKV